MTKRWTLLLLLIAINLGSFYYYLLGLMRLQPIFLAAIIEFVVVFVSIILWNKRNVFRGARLK